jgi:hypothetical protein
MRRVSLSLFHIKFHSHLREDRHFLQHALNSPNAQIALCICWRDELDKVFWRSIGAGVYPIFRYRKIKKVLALKSRMQCPYQNRISTKSSAFFAQEALYLRNSITQIQPRIAKIPTRKFHLWLYMTSVSAVNLSRSLNTMPTFRTRIINTWETPNELALVHVGKTTSSQLLTRFCTSTTPVAFLYARAWI